MYPLAKPQMIYPVGAASCHSGLILAALKITRGGMVIPPVLMYNTIVVFIGFSPLMVWKLHSPVTPTTVLGWGTSPTLHSSMFYMFSTNGLEATFSSDSNYCTWLGDITHSTFINVLYVVRQVFEYPIVNPFFVLVEEMADLCWVG